MTKMKTTYLGHLHNEVEHLQSGTKITTDAPLDNHGLGQSFSPTDLFASSLSCCMLTIIGISAESYGFDITGTTVETEKIMNENPRRVGELKLTVNLPKGKNYTDQQKRLIESAIKTCPVGRSLNPDIKVDITFNY
jgi:putative redox protein